MNDVLFLALSTAVFLALFVYGLRSGRMPMKVGHADRGKNPALFRIAGAVLLVFIAVFAFATVVAWLRR